MKFTTRSLQVMLTGALLFLTNAAAAETIRVMTFNIWGDGRSGQQPLTQTAAAIRAAKPDIVGLQELNGYSEEKLNAMDDDE